MSGKIQTRLALLAALAALVAVVVPATLAFGSHSSGLVAEDGVVLLTLGRTDEIRYGSSFQAITTKKNDCTAVDHLSEPTTTSILVVAERPTDGSVKSLGESKDGIGVQGAMDGSGEPCARTEARTAPTLNEAISVKLDTDMAGKVFGGWDIDFELKFNSTIRATLRLGGTNLPTPNNLVPFSNDSSSDNGPDSKDGDNYRWYYKAPVGVHFDEVVFEATSGAFSLEGGADLQTNNAPEAFGKFDPSSKSSQFLILKEFDGDLTCGETHTISSSVFPNVSGVVKLHSIDQGSGHSTSVCPEKFFDDAVGSNSLAFVPTLADTTARYTIDVTLTNQTITVDGGGVVTSLKAEYNTNGDLTFPDATTDPMQACQAQPVLADDPATGGVNEYVQFWEGSVSLLPSGENACWYHASVVATGPGVGTELWGIYFEDDPGFSFR